MRYMLIVLSFFAGPLLFGVCDFGKVRKKIASVDVVYTWVDAEDPVWILSLNEAVEKNRSKMPAQAYAKAQVRSRDELKYSLRSIWKYAPFVNHIYIVTCGQAPKWLKPHPKITLVQHDEIFKEKEDLPTFNSQAIEASIHRIQNLKECYIYLNDDVFLGDSAVARDYFSENGQPKFFSASWDTPEGQIEQGDSTFEASWKNTNTLLNRLFGYKKRKALEHAPFSFRKSQQQTIEKCFHAIFKKISSHTFRSYDDYVVTAGFSQYLLSEYGLAKRSRIQSVVVGIKDSLEDNNKALQHISRIRPRTFCVEDDMTIESEEQNVLLHEFFESYYPEKAPWEL